MNQTLIILVAVGVTGILIITGIEVYQFVQQQQALDKIDKMLNPEPQAQPKALPPIADIKGYHTYQECINFWNSSKHLEDIKKENLTPDKMCEAYK